MCRLAAWHGTPRPLSGLLTDEPWSLYEQAYRPREMQFGTLNVDGTGIAWWDPADREGDPLRYATPTPPWADANLASLMPRLTSHLQVQAVRSATPGIPYGTANVAPFVHAGHAFAHNGFVQGFREGAGRSLRRRVDADLLDTMDAVSDSLVVFMLVLTHRRSQPDLPSAVTAALADVGDVVRSEGRGAALNVAVADGTTLVVTRCSVELPLNSLYTRSTDAGVTVASEPMDPAHQWAEVPAGSAAVVDHDGLRFQPLDV